MDETMSDSDSLDDSPLFQSKSNSSEDIKINLDPAATLAERNKYSNNVKRIENLKKCVDHGPSISAPAKVYSEMVVQLDKSSQEIKYIHPGCNTFNPVESCSIFVEENLKLFDFAPKNEIPHMIFELNESEFYKLICNRQLERVCQQREVTHNLCLYLFFVISVHRDERTVEYSTRTLLYIKEDWFPSIDIIFLVFINWGIKSEILDLECIEDRKCIPFEISKSFKRDSRKLDFNIQKILQIIASSARGIVKSTSDDKLDKLIYVLVLSALEPGSDVIAYSHCISSLLSNIPENLWNCNR
ncbi:hypothetical protein L9F63_022852, partial [Diploptera punctata]